MPTLDILKPGQAARIVDVDGDDAVAARILEMGFTDGEEIRLLGKSPFGDPLEFSLRGFRISLRISEARRVSVELL